MEYAGAHVSLGTHAGFFIACLLIWAQKSKSIRPMMHMRCSVLHYSPKQLKRLGTCLKCKNPTKQKLKIAACSSSDVIQVCGNPDPKVFFFFSTAFF